MIFLAAKNGLITAETGETWQFVGQSLAGTPVTSAATAPGYLLAGTTNGIFRSIDYGQTWQQAGSAPGLKYVRWLYVHPEMEGYAFAGTEPAGIYASVDSGETWEERGEVAEMRDRLRWFLPYSPEAGCVRGFAFHGTTGYAAVEVGGALRTDDNGQHWRLVEGSDGQPDMRRIGDGMIHPDVHSIHVHPTSADLVYAPTGGGFYRSVDGGRTWQCAYRCYVRAVWVDPADTKHLVLGPADGVSRNGRIEQTRDGGKTWQAAAGLPAVPWPDKMVERFAQVGDTLAAVLSNGEVWVRPLRGGEWRTMVGQSVEIRAIAG